MDQNKPHTSRKELLRLDVCMKCILQAEVDPVPSKHLQREQWTAAFSPCLIGTVAIAMGLKLG